MRCCEGGFVLGLPPPHKKFSPLASSFWPLVTLTTLSLFVHRWRSFHSFGEQSTVPSPRFPFSSFNLLFCNHYFVEGASAAIVPLPHNLTTSPPFCRTLFLEFLQVVLFLSIRGISLFGEIHIHGEILFFLRYLPRFMMLTGKGGDPPWPDCPPFLPLRSVVLFGKRLYRYHLLARVPLFSKL